MSECRFVDPSCDWTLPLRSSRTAFWGSNGTDVSRSTTQKRPRPAGGRRLDASFHALDTGKRRSADGYDVNSSPPLGRRTLAGYLRVSRERHIRRRCSPRRMVRLVVVTGTDRSAGRTEEFATRSACAAAREHRLDRGWFLHARRLSAPSASLPSSAGSLGVRHRIRGALSRRTRGGHQRRGRDGADQAVITSATLVARPSAASVVTRGNPRRTASST